MTQDRLFAPSESTVANALIDNSGYQAMYDASISDPDAFWAEHGKRIDWIKPYSQVSDVSYDKADLHISWFGDGTLNAAANCLAGISRAAATRPPSYGKATTRRIPGISAMPSCMRKSANSPMC